MARPLRIEYPGAYYHVINRGNNQKKKFKNKAREVAIFIARDMTGIDHHHLDIFVDFKLNSFVFQLHLTFNYFR